MISAYLILAHPPVRRAVPPRPRQPIYHKTMQSLAAITAAVTVPAHGYVSFSRRPQLNSFRSQVWTFAKQLLRGCAWAAAIAAGMLVYTAFVQKWKENGFPTIPISALVAMDQATKPGTPSNVIPLGSGGTGNANPPGRTPTPTRQTNILNLEEYEG